MESCEAGQYKVQHVRKEVVVVTVVLSSNPPTEDVREADVYPRLATPVPLIIVAAYIFASLYGL